MKTKSKIFLCIGSISLLASIAIPTSMSILANNQQQTNIIESNVLVQKASNNKPQNNNNKPQNNNNNNKPANNNQNNKKSIKLEWWVWVLVGVGGVLLISIIITIIMAIVNKKKAPNVINPDVLEDTFE